MRPENSVLCLTGWRMAWIGGRDHEDQVCGAGCVVLGVDQPFP